MPPRTSQGPGLQYTSSVDSFISGIQLIGENLVACGELCAGIHRDQSIGSLPRCLFLEIEGRGISHGCAVVGINPGRASGPERQFYCDNNRTYEAVREWFKIVGFRHRYYTGLRKFINQLGLSGPILWTELAKCESAAGVTGLPPLATLRTCTARYLTSELALLPAEWPLIAVGGEVFKALAYLYPQRSVVGVPHPTGARGHFARLFAGGTVRETIQAAVNNCLNGGAPLVWLRAPQD